ncbi:MAG: ATPase [Streptosporangiales bacterium]|nr:ATPase [Streptosporangiales bacterium]
MGSETTPAAGSGWGETRLHFVTGKGGTGKTTVAGALALSLAAEGRRTLLVEVEGRQGIAQLFDVAPLPYEERRVAVARDGGEVYALAVDPEAALLDYLDMFYKLGRAGRSLERLGVVDFVTTVAPGLRDVLLTGKAAESVRRRSGSGYAYDAVVVDAPPTGRIARFLNVSNEVAGIARMGPVRTHADLVLGVIRSAQTAVHFVSLLEEMPVQETVDGVAELEQTGIATGAVVVNMTRNRLLPTAQLAAAARGEVDTDALQAGLTTARLNPSAEAVRALAAELTDHALRVSAEDEARETLEKLDRPTIELPFLPHGVDIGALHELAEAIEEQVANWTRR